MSNAIVSEQHIITHYGCAIVSIPPAHSMRLPRTADICN